MTFAPAASVGKDGKNLLNDVVATRTVLTALVPGAITSPLLEAKCTPDLVEAIRRFQSVYMETPDSRIDPGKGTVKRINVLLAQGNARMHNVPLKSQGSVKKCWEASARMMLQWRMGSDRIYNANLDAFAREDTGRQEHQMDWFYQQLGMRSLRGPKGLDLLSVLGRGPAIVTEVDKKAGHAEVVTGYDHVAGTYRINNPAGVTTYSFDDAGQDSGAGAATNMAMKLLEKRLGKYLWHW